MYIYRNAYATDCGSVCVGEACGYGYDFVRYFECCTRPNGTKFLCATALFKTTTENRACTLVPVGLYGSIRYCQQTPGFIYGQREIYACESGNCNFKSVTGSSVPPCSGEQVVGTCS